MKFEKVNEVYYGGPADQPATVKNVQDYLERSAEKSKWLTANEKDDVAVLEFPFDRWMVYFKGKQKTFNSPREVIDFLVSRLS